jgi:hypothetical protein
VGEGVGREFQIRPSLQGLPAQDELTGVAAPRRLASYIRERDKRTILASEIEQRGPVDCFHTFNETYNDCVVSAYKYLIGPALDVCDCLRY